MAKFATSRRNFLKTAAAGASGLMLGSILPKRALAQTSLASRKYVFAYFSGGWDMLLGLDPRDPATTTVAANQIDTGYGQLGALGAVGVQRAGNLSFGPAVPQEFLAHAPDCSIIRAVGMDTASHEVGRRYFITGRFPRGLNAVGSSTAAEIAAQLGDNTPIPNLAAAVEDYARGLPTYATGLSVNSVADLNVALTPFTEVEPSVLRAVEAYQDEGLGCAGKRLDQSGLATSLLSNQKRARGYISAMLDQNFNLGRNDPEMQGLIDLYGVANAGFDPTSPETLSFVAGQALKNEVSQCVSVRVARDLDTHANWAQDQPAAQVRGWRALAALMSDLKATAAADQSGQSVFDQTTFVVFSEFARTPLFNNLQGRGHFLGNACLVAGPGLKRNMVVGESANVGMMPLATNIQTGAVIPSPTEAQLSSGEAVMMSPKHVLATVLEAAGLDHSYLRSAPITPLLDG